jgi:hypothetical protein
MSKKRYICTYSKSHDFASEARRHQVDDFRMVVTADNYRLAGWDILNQIPWDDRAEWELSGGVWVYVALDDADNKHPNGMPIRVNAIHFIATISQDIEYNRKGNTDANDTANATT